MIAREAVLNALRHAEASRVDIYLSVRGHQIGLRVVDDGKGLAKADTSKKTPTGYGVIGMKERAGRMDGTLTVVPAKPRGTEVRLVAPRPRGSTRP